MLLVHLPLQFEAVHHCLLDLALATSACPAAASVAAAESAAVAGSAAAEEAHL